MPILHSNARKHRQENRLNGTDHKYLGFIIQKGQMTAGEPAVLTGLTTGSVTGLIDRFESKTGKETTRQTDRRK